MRSKLPEILKKAEELLTHVYTVVARFAHAHKYGYGAELKDKARAIGSLTNKAWRDRKNQRQWVEDLVWLIDDFKQHLRLGADIQAFKSFEQFVALIRLAEDFGSRVGGWKKSLKPKGQNSAEHTSPQERAQILSTQAASYGASV